MRKNHSWGLQAGLAWVVCLVVAGWMAGSAFADSNRYNGYDKHKSNKNHGYDKHKSNDGYGHMPQSMESKNFKLLGWNDLQGRETLQITVNGDWAYAGHHNRFFAGTPLHFNPLTGVDEENGTTILNISDPYRPRIVAHIPSPENRNCRSTSTVYNFMDSGKDYLVRNSEGATFPYDKFEIFDITKRAQGITGIFKVGEIWGTPEGSCDGGGAVCGGNFLANTHKGYLSPSGYYFAGADEPGFRSGIHLIVFDLRNLPNVPPSVPPSPTNRFDDTFVGRGWLSGQKLTEDELVDPIAGHHPIVDEENDRVYMGYLTGGDIVAWNINPINPELPNREYPVMWTIDTHPPGKEAHTVTMIKYDQVPNFNDSWVSGHPTSEPGLPRLYVLLSDEAVGGSMWRFTDTPPGVREGVREKLTMFDATNADTQGFPFPVSSWQVPPEKYIMRGGRFGPHQYNEDVNSKFNKFEDKIAFVAYFNAGVRAVDISDPYKMEEIGYYVPQETPMCGFIGGDQPSPNIQTNDVTVDYRGLVVISDRVGCGLHILDFKKDDKKHHKN